MLKVFACASALAAAAAASGGVVSFEIFENAGGADTAPVSVGVTLTDMGGTIHFTFTNSSSINAIITSVYLEVPSLSVGSLSGGTVFAMSSGVNMSPPPTPANPPGSISGFDTSWGGTLFGAAKNGSVHNGINPGEWITLSLTASGGATAASVQAALANRDEMRIAMHIQNVGPNGANSIWGVNVPTPGSLALAGLGGLIVVGRRRR